MAVKKSAPKKKPPVRKAARDGDLAAAITDAALALAAETGWAAVTMAVVAARASLPLGDVLLYAPTRAHLLARFLDRLDAENLKGVDHIDQSESARDRLFEVLMRRFDLLNRKRDAVQAVISGVPRDPPAAAMLACRGGRSAAALLGAAGISAEGLVGFARIQGLKAVMAFALRAWLKDDSADMAKTMAALDRALDRAERFARFKPWRRSGGEASA
jgi:AcrR family transcriptional regulator